MPPKVTKPKPTLETSKKPSEGIKPLKVRATNGESELKVPSVGRSRGASCPRCPPREPGHRDSAIVGSRDRTRSSSTAPKLTAQCTKAYPGYKEPNCPAKQATVEAKCSQQGAHGQTQKHRLESTNDSHKAFTVIPPDPKKRLEIQRKAEAELAALEELRLSKAMTYVSISPSAVGGCLSLEEVRLKQQQEMMQAKRKPRQIKEPVVVLTS